MNLAKKYLAVVLGVAVLATSASAMLVVQPFSGAVTGSSRTIDIDLPRGLNVGDGLLAITGTFFAEGSTFDVAVQDVPGSTFISLNAASSEFTVFPFLQAAGGLAAVALTQQFAIPEAILASAIDLNDLTLRITQPAVGPSCNPVRNFSGTVSYAVPEPATMTMLAIGGLAGCGAIRRRRTVTALA